MVEFFHVDIDEIPLEGSAGLLVFQFFSKLFSGVVPFNVIVFIVEGFDKDTDVVVSAEEMLELLIWLLFEGITDWVELFFGVSPFAEKVIDGVKAASEREVVLAFKVGGGFLGGFHGCLALYEIVFGLDR